MAMGGQLHGITGNDQVSGASAGHYRQKRQGCHRRLIHHHRVKFHIEEQVGGTDFGQGSTHRFLGNQFVKIGVLQLCCRVSVSSSIRRSPTPAAKGTDRREPAARRAPRREQPPSREVGCRGRPELGERGRCGSAAPAAEPGARAAA